MAYEGVTGVSSRLGRDGALTVARSKCGHAIGHLVLITRGDAGDKSTGRLRAIKALPLYQYRSRGAHDGVDGQLTGQRIDIVAHEQERDCLADGAINLARQRAAS